MAKAPETVESVQRFYQRYPQLESSEVTWINALDWRERTVLDAGCGDGSILQAIHARHQLRKGIGLDTSAESLAVASSNTAPGLEWVRGSIFAIPLADAEVDDVISIGVLHYFEDPAPAIEEFARVVKPGGRVILFVYRPHLVHTVRQWLRRRYERQLVQRLETIRSETERNLVMNTVAPPPYWPLCRSRLREIAAAQGLEIDRLTYKPTHVPELILRGTAGTNVGILRRGLANAAGWLARVDPLHAFSFGYYVVYRRKVE